MIKDCVPGVSLRGTSPRQGNDGLGMMLNPKQSDPPSTMSKGTASTSATRKTAQNNDPPLLFLKKRVISSEVIIGCPLNAVNSAL